MKKTQAILDTLNYRQDEANHAIRTSGLKSNPLFAAQDIYSIIGLTQTSTAIKRMDPAEKKTSTLNNKRCSMLTTKGVLNLTTTKSLTDKQKKTLGKAWDLQLMRFRAWFKETTIAGYESSFPTIKDTFDPDRLANHTITRRPMLDYSRKEDYKRYITGWC